MEIVYIIFLGLGIEMLTAIMRLIYHLQSAPLQHKLHIPRTHHAYIGGLLLIWFYFFNPADALAIGLLVIGWALVLSDIVHHMIFLPLIKAHGYDTHMIHHRVVHRYYRDVVGILLIIGGVIGWVTPVVPGTVLVILGLIMIWGRKRTGKILVHWLGKRRYKKYHLDQYFGAQEHKVASK